MDFFKKLRSSSLKGPKNNEEESWGVILKGVPDKKVEEALIRILTERLNVPGDDALKIIRSSPIILFSDRSAREAEQIKLILNKAGVRTAISNDPSDFRTLPRVAWPQKIEVSHLEGEEIQAPLPPLPSPKSTKPIVPPAPKVPIPPPAPPPVTDEWKIKYESLLRSHSDLVERSEKNFRELQTRLKILTEEKDKTQKALEEIRKELTHSQEAQQSLQREKTALETERTRLAQEKERAEKTLGEIRKELMRSQEIRESLQKEINLLRLDRERLIPEVEKIKSAMEAQLKISENLLNLVKESPKPLGLGPKPAQAPITPILPPKRSPKGGTGSTPVGIIPPSST